MLMQLISDIINELVDTEKSLTSPLLKTKVLATRIKNINLLNWVNCELNGYDDIGELPSYRSCIANISGSYINGTMHVPDQPLPLSGLPNDFQKALRQMNFVQSVEGLESLIKNSKGDLLEYSFPAEVTSVIEHNIRKKGNPYLQLIRARRYVSSAVLSETLSAIRSKLLDFSLKIEEEFGYVTEFEQLKSKNDKISRIMSQTIITGNGNVVTSGNSNQVSAFITISTGSKEDLEQVLSNSNVQSEEIQDLLKVIDKDPPKGTIISFNPEVNSWIQKMIGKALDGSWQISVGAAGSLLAEAIKAYYGL